MEKTRMTPSFLVLVSGTPDGNRKLWRQGQHDKSDFRNRKNQHDVLLKPTLPIKCKRLGKLKCNHILKSSHSQMTLGMKLVHWLLHSRK